MWTNHLTNKTPNDKYIALFGLFYFIANCQKTIIINGVVWLCLVSSVLAWIFFLGGRVALGGFDTTGCYCCWMPLLVLMMVMTVMAGSGDIEHVLCCSNYKLSFW